VGIINRAQNIELSFDREELRSSHYCNDPAVIAEYNARINTVTKALATLSPKLERIIRLYYGFNIEGMMLKCIAESVLTYHSGIGMHPVSRTMIGELLRRGERRLRHPEISRKILSRLMIRY